MKKSIFVSMLLIALVIAVLLLDQNLVSAKKAKGKAKAKKAPEPEKKAADPPKPKSKGKKKPRVDKSSGLRPEKTSPELYCNVCQAIIREALKTLK